MDIASGRACFYINIKAFGLSGRAADWIGRAAAWVQVKHACRTGTLNVIPAMVTLGILRFMGNWNSFLYPLIVTTKAEMRTFLVGLGTVARSGGDAGIDMAGAALGFVPTFVVFLLGKRYIIQGVSLSGLKG